MCMIDKIYSWFEKFRRPFPDDIPTMPPKTLGGFIRHYARPFSSLIITASILSTIIALLELYLFSFVGSLIDWLTLSSPETFWQTHWQQLCLIMLLILIVLPGLQFLSVATVNQGLLGNFAMRTRWQAHRYLLRQSIEFFHNDFAGRVAAKMMQTSLGVRDTVVNLIEVILYVLVYFLGALLLFADSHILLTLPLVIWLAVYIRILVYFVPKLMKVSMDQAEARSMVTGRVVDSYTNITTIKMFAHAGYEDEYARESMEVFLGTVYQQMRLASNLTLTIHTLNALLFVSIIATSVVLWQGSLITTGAIAFSLGLVLRIKGMSQWIMWEIWGLFENIGVIMDGIETISHDISIHDHGAEKPLKVGAGQIEYQNIFFNYGKNDGAHNYAGRGVISDLNLSIQGGEKIGVVGRSGAGKSTLVNLLLRFYEYRDGAISIDGQNIQNVKQDSLRSQIGMVTQDTSLLHRSVAENIRYGNHSASHDDVIKAALQARAHDFILELEDSSGRAGYQAQVGERGVKLSGGQRQRIAIARVLLKNAPILVLDEATSALDSEVEAAIQESLYELMQGKTVIAIAHRLSTIAQMDRLVIMDNGKIIEQGTHQKLLAAGGLYSELWARQSGGFLAQEIANAAVLESAT